MIKTTNKSKVYPLPFVRLQVYYINLSYNNIPKKSVGPS